MSGDLPADDRRHTLSPLIGEFTSAAQEARFRASAWPVWDRRIRVVVLAGVAAYLITSLTDFLLLGTGLLFTLIVVARVLVSAYGLGFVMLSARRHSPRFSDLGLLVFLLLLITSFLGMVSVRPESLRFSAPGAVLILCIFYAIPMTRMWITLASALYLSSGLAVVAWWFEQSPLREIAVIGVQLAVVNLIGFFIARQLHKDARQSWVNQQLLQRREQHQRLLAQISSQLLGVRNDRIGEAVGQALRTLCEQTGTDRAYLMEFDRAHETGSVTQEWCREGVPPTRDAMQAIPSATMPWAALKMQRGEPVMAEDVNALPPEAAVERDTSRAQGVRAFLCVPLAHAGELLGMIGLDNVHAPQVWHAETVELLRFAGQAIFNAVHRTRAEAQLHERERQYETLAGLSPIGIFRTDVNGNCVYFNDRWTPLTGRPTETALGTAWQAAVHPEDLDVVRASWSQAVARQSSLDMEFRYQRPDGEITWVEARARPVHDARQQLIGFVGTVDDIGERKRTQLELEHRARFDEFTKNVTMQFLRASGDRLEETIQRVLGDVGLFMDADRAYLFLHDWQDGTISCVHEWCREGTTKEIETLQRMPLESYGWLTGPLLRGEGVNLSSLDQMPPEAAQERAELERQSIRSMLLMPIFSSGQLTGFVGLDAVRAPRSWSPDANLLLRLVGETMLNAIQQRENHETQQQRTRELEQLNLQLEQRNIDLHKLAYVASHDLQEPLRTVSSFSSLLGQNYRGRLDARADEYISYITGAAARLHRLIHDLLAYTRIDQQVNAPVTCDLNEIARIARDNLAETVQTLEARIEIGKLPTVRAEPLQMIQLVQHLMANALRFRASSAPRITVRAERQEDEWVISVADNGIGVAPEHSKRIFDVFRRLRPNDSYAGSGIGLAICRRIVERHNGRIWVEPNAPSGSVFRWTLPTSLKGLTSPASGSRHAA